MKLTMFLLIAVSSLLFISNAIADCSKHKKSCIGAGCEMSNAKYEQCIASENNKKTQLAHRENESLSPAQQIACYRNQLLKVSTLISTTVMKCNIGHYSVNL
ncbi:hypothetical protein NBRC116592_03790 [Colwellia sp. KU-HH00111]|uniref:hypothetical protein n=1 Tax=Colwellia sp. KU-HH00111 TaxID=3127652 RepID=UPI0031078441